MTDAEINRWVAEKFFGEAKPNYVNHEPGHVMQVKLSEQGFWMCDLMYEEGDVCKWTPLDFCSDVVASRQVLNKLLSLPNASYEFRLEDGEYHAAFRQQSNHQMTVYAKAATFEKAVAMLATLLSMVD